MFRGVSKQCKQLAVLITALPSKAFHLTLGLKFSRIVSSGVNQSALRTVPTNGRFCFVLFVCLLVCFFSENDYAIRHRRSYQGLLKSKKKTRGNRAFFSVKCTLKWRDKC